MEKGGYLGKGSSFVEKKGGGGSLGGILFCEKSWGIGERGLLSLKKRGGGRLVSLRRILFGGKRWDIGEGVFFR